MDWMSSLHLLTAGTVKCTSTLLLFPKPQLTLLFPVRYSQEEMVSFMKGEAPAQQALNCEEQMIYLRSLCTLLRTLSWMSASPGWCCAGATAPVALLHGQSR